MANDVKVLVKQLSSGTRDEQANAAESLARMGRDAQPAAASLVAALLKADASMREWCVAALEELGPPPITQIADIVNLSQEDSLDAAYWAATLLGRAGIDAASSIPALVRLLQSSPESAVRERAAWALGNIGTAAVTAVPALRETAADSNPRLARLAQQAIDQIES